MLALCWRSVAPVTMVAVIAHALRVVLSWGVQASGYKTGFASVDSLGSGIRLWLFLFWDRRRLVGRNSYLGGNLILFYGLNITWVMRIVLGFEYCAHFLVVLVLNETERADQVHSRHKAVWSYIFSIDYLWLGLRFREGHGKHERR